MSIQPLPADVISQIRSSITITSLNGVVFELVKNSLDAEATKVDISVDYARGGCVIEDDGLGILPSDFEENGGLGKLYRECHTHSMCIISLMFSDTSKLASQNCVHGGDGTFIASLSAVSLLSITSHHHRYRSYNALKMHQSRVISRQLPAPPHQYLPSFDHGTRVSVTDLFGNMPVRVRQRAISAEKYGGNSKEWEALRRDVVILLLAWPLGVSMTLREVGTGQKMVIRRTAANPAPGLNLDVSNIRNILSQATLITASGRSSWVPIAASTARFRITGAISLEPSATKNVQYAAFGIQPLIVPDRQSILHDEINRLFQHSAFGNQDDAENLNDAEQSGRVRNKARSEHGFTGKQIKGARKSIDRWPMFYFNIQEMDMQTGSRRPDVEGLLYDKTGTLNDVITLLRTMILEFLTKYHFQPKFLRGRGLPHSIDQTSVKANPTTSSIQAIHVSSSTKGSQVAKNYSTKGNKSNTEILGANVKVPSFHHLSSKPESPFHMWSRVKSGSLGSKSIAFKDAVRVPASHSPLLRPATAPLPHNQHSSASTRVSRIGLPGRSISYKSSSPLVASSGKITRTPFEEVILPCFGSGYFDTEQGSSTNANPFDTAGDIIKWTDPITKLTLSINRRTGLALPAENPGTSKPYITSRKRLRSAMEPKAQEGSLWIESLLQDWENPIFRPVEIRIPQLSLGMEEETQRLLHGHKHNCTQLDIDKAFKEVSAGVNGRISKDSLQNAEIISQVDKKFILVKIKCEDGNAKSEHHGQDTLVVIDQHAADERIRIEGLLAALCTTTDAGIVTTTLDKPLSFEVSFKEIAILRTYHTHFTNWGIVYDLPSIPAGTSEEQTQRLIVRALPYGISERCRLEPRVLIELVRGELWALHSSTLAPSSRISTTINSHVKHPWLTRIHNCPQGLLDILNSRACRSAVMFNDELSKEQCQILIERLADCAFPFQCAHGRPSLVPLVDLGAIESAYSGVGPAMDYDNVNGYSGGGFGKPFREWKAKQGR